MLHATEWCHFRLLPGVAFDTSASYRNRSCFHVYVLRARVTGDTTTCYRAGAIIVIPHTCACIRSGTPNALNGYKMNTQPQHTSWPNVAATPGRPLTMGQELGAYLARMDQRAARISSMLARVETIAAASRRS